MEYTEDELSTALGDIQETKNDSIINDLEEEVKEESATEQEVQEEPKEEEPAEETKEEPAQETEEQEPAKEESAKEEPAEEAKEPEMILGKFKSQEDLIKAYQNLEKRFSEKSQEVKDVQNVTTNDFDKAVSQKIAEENWKLVEKAFDTIDKPEDAKEAQFLLMQFKRTGNADYLEQARGFLDKRVDRRLEVDAMNTAAKIQQEANAHREEILLKPLSDELDKMLEEDPEFMNDTENQNLMAMAIKLNPTTVDVRAVKKEIQNYGKSRYQKGYEAAKKEFAKQAEQKTIPIKSVARVEKPVVQKNYDNMSISEQLAEEMKDIDLL